MKISEKKKEKIYEQILALLYSVFPKAIFTLNIAEEIARDEEFVKSLLLNLKKKELVVEIKKNPKGGTSPIPVHCVSFVYLHLFCYLFIAR